MEEAEQGKYLILSVCVCIYNLKEKSRMLDKEGTILSKDLLIWHVDKQKCSHLGASKNMWYLITTGKGKTLSTILC